jgi:hypothetical protein
MQSGQNASFGILPEGAGFWISVVLVQARFDYRFFLFASALIMAENYRGHAQTAPTHRPC